MKTFAAKEAKNGFGRLIDTAQREPVVIERKGRPVAVVLSMDDYRHFEKVEDAYWAARAEETEKDAEWVGAEESERALQGILDAQD